MEEEPGKHYLIFVSRGSCENASVANLVFAVSMDLNVNLSDEKIAFELKETFVLASKKLKPFTEPAEILNLLFEWTTVEVPQDLIDIFEDNYFDMFGNGEGEIAKVIHFQDFDRFLEGEVGIEAVI